MNNKAYKYNIKCAITFIILALLFAGCNKSVTTSSDTATTNNNSENSNTLTGNPSIKFYTVMDYGDSKVTYKLNKNTPVTIAKYFPSSQYSSANIGTNDITLYYPENTSTSVLSKQVDLAAGCTYSCFFYRVGYEWKLSLVKDDLTAPKTSTNSKIRVLDFRTQAYFDYVNVHIYSLGGDEKYYTNRNFLDHETYSSNTLFKELIAGTSYAIVYNDTINLASRKNINLVAGKIYSVVLMTPSTESPSQAIYDIYPDIYLHN